MALLTLMRSSAHSLASSPVVLGDTNAFTLRNLLSHPPDVFLDTTVSYIAWQ